VQNADPNFLAVSSRAPAIYPYSNKATTPRNFCGETAEYNKTNNSRLLRALDHSCYIVTVTGQSIS